MKIKLRIRSVVGEHKLAVGYDWVELDLRFVEGIVDVIETHLHNVINMSANVTFSEFSIMGLGGEETAAIQIPNLIGNQNLTVNNTLDLFREIQKIFKAFEGEDLHLQLAKLIASMNQNEHLPTAINQSDDVILDIIHAPNISRFEARNLILKKAMAQMVEEAKNAHLSEVVIEALTNRIDKLSFENYYFDNAVKFEWLETTNYFYITKR